MSSNTNYADIRKNIETILESNIPQLSNEYRELIVNSIMTTLRDSGLKPNTWTPRYITDIEEVKDWSICGFRVEDLVKFALILREKKIEDVDIRDYNYSFLCGYERAQADILKQIKEHFNLSTTERNNEA